MSIRSSCRVLDPNRSSHDDRQKEGKKEGGKEERKKDRKWCGFLPKPRPYATW